jgi:hypothetical protein
VHEFGAARVKVQQLIARNHGVAGFVELVERNPQLNLGKFKFLCLAHRVLQGVRSTKQLQYICKGGGCGSNTWGGEEGESVRGAADTTTCARW